MCRTGAALLWPWARFLVFVIAAAVGPVILMWSQAVLCNGACSTLGTSSLSRVFLRR